MAWFGLVAAVNAGPESKVVVSVDFYDDTILVDGAPKTQFSKQFSFGYGTTQADMRAQIQSVGADARSRITSVANLAAKVGTTIPIP